MNDQQPTAVDWAKFWASDRMPTPMFNPRRPVYSRRWRKSKRKRKRHPLCCYCAKMITDPGDLTWEHLVPKSAGGNDQPANKRRCCHTCNQERGKIPLDQWLTAMEVEAQRISITDERFAMLKRRIPRVREWIKYIKGAGWLLYQDGAYPG